MLIWPISTEHLSIPNKQAGTKEVLFIKASLHIWKHVGEPDENIYHIYKSALLITEDQSYLPLIIYLHTVDVDDMEYIQQKQITAQNKMSAITVHSGIKLFLNNIDARVVNRIMVLNIKLLEEIRLKEK